MPDEALLDLLTASRTDNERKQLTGMLLYVKPNEASSAPVGRFIQVLEGEEQAVMALYENIKRDIRHQQVTLLHQGPVYFRSFAEWNMGFKSLLEEEYLQIPGYIKLDEQFIQGKSLLSVGVAFNFLKSFYSIKG